MCEIYFFFISVKGLIKLYNTLGITLGIYNLNSFVNEICFKVGLEKNKT